MKTQIYPAHKGTILDVNGGHRGRRADVKIWNETELPEELEDRDKIADKAYVGSKKPTRTPKKKPKGGELSEADKAENKKISQERIVVEHSIRKVKSYRIVIDEYRLTQGIFPMVLSAIVELIQLADLMN